jgi:hypothetical protein
LGRGEKKRILKIKRAERDRKEQFKIQKKIGIIVQ